MRKIWKIRQARPDLQEDIASSLHISKITAQILANRGIEDSHSAAQFLNSEISSCHDPYLLKDMDKAVDRIKKAVRVKEKILVYGDYDVDGMTAVALLLTALRDAGAEVESYIPNRLEEGYGLNCEAVRKAHKTGVRLIITVDCGIGSFREIELAKSLSIDVIITDHHEIIDSRVPAGYAVINPIQDGCMYPFKHLAGVGIAYKLASALNFQKDNSHLKFLDLVSLGTIADIAPLTGENRVLAKYGMRELNKRTRAGLEALMEVAGLSGKDISPGHIGFILGPRINAMGRIGSPQTALDLLMAKEKDEALRLAGILDAENRNRQKIEARIQEEALAMVEREVNFKDHKVIVLASKGWHTGVIGIVASRLADRFYRPTILLSLDGETVKGSGRSIDNFHLFDYLSRCRDVLIGFGGHESACGLTMDKERIEDFRIRINEEAAKEASKDVYFARLNIDMEIFLNMLNEDVVNELETLAPFGSENPQPVLSSSNLIVRDAPRRIGRGGFKMLVAGNGITCEAVSFGRSELPKPRAGDNIDIAYCPSINNWQGLKSIQLELKDINITR